MQYFLISQISVCKMKKNRRNYYRRDGPFVECELSRSDDYERLIEKIASFLNMNNSPLLSLYRPHGGAYIPNQDLVVNDISLTWTLGSYMRVRHIGPEAVQIGIGSSSRSNEEV
jgi:hypothetical protein